MDNIGPDAERLEETVDILLVEREVSAWLEVDLFVDDDGRTGDKNRPRPREDVPTDNVE